MMKTLRWFVLLLVALPLLGHTKDEKEDIPSFKVEVIVFEARETNEKLPAIKNPFFSNLDSAILLEPNLMQEDFSLLNKSNFRLNWQEKRLRNQHNILLHLAWLQSEDNKKPIFVDSQLFNADYPLIDNVKGTIQIEKDRFFSLSTHLILDKACELSEETRCYYPMSEKRNLKANQLYYLDHPLYGLLVQITSNNKKT